MAELDSILSGKGDTEPTPEPAPVAEPKDDRPRDEHGRFIKAEGEAPPASDDPPAEPQQQPAPAPQAPAEAAPQAPVAAVTAERAKRQDAEQKLAALETQFRQLQQQVSAIPKPQPPPPEPAPDWYAAPDQALNYHVRQALDPVQQQLMFNARLIAEARDGEEAVKEAIAAFDQATATGQIDPADTQRVMTSPNPFHEAAMWHKRRQAQAEIGDDPAAYRERVRQEILAELQAAEPPAPPPASGQQQQPVMPSNLAGARSVGTRSGPAWGGPVTLQSIFAQRK